MEEGISPLNKEEIFRILDQMNKCVCLVYLGECRGTGFFLNISFPKKNTIIPFLVTANHIINEDTINEHKVIVLSILDKKEIRKIELKNRFIYTNMEEDITLIEIKPSFDHINNFLDLDENILSNNRDQIFYKLPVYLLQYPGGIESQVSFGNIIKIKEQTILHNCWTDYGSAGGPIISKRSFKVIGLHVGRFNKMQGKGYKMGYFLNKAIIEIQNKY